MRVRASLVIAFLIVGCGGDDEDPVVAGDTGAPVTETGGTDTGAAAETTVTDTGSLADTFVADTFVADTGGGETSAMTCTTCHGTAGAGNAAPPKGTGGETATTSPAVGAHQIHLGTSTWRRDITCNECHLVPTSMTHANGANDFAWGTVAKADGASPAYNSTSYTCTGSYCHGTTLQPAATGGTTLREPVWNKVDGTQSACGTTCHTNPPGGTHPAMNTCETCHGTTISAYDPTTKAATWADRTKHIDGD